MTPEEQNDLNKRPPDNDPAIPNSSPQSDESAGKDVSEAEDTVIESEAG